MIKVFFGGTPNAYKVTIALQEMGTPYVLEPVNVLDGEQYSDEYTRVNPNSKIPAIIDDEPLNGAGPVTVFESGAILVYLAEKTGQLLPKEGLQRYQVMQWLMWQMAGFGPMLGQTHHFLRYADQDIPYAIRRYHRETKRLYGVLNKHLADREFIADSYSIADIAIWPWVYFRSLQDISLEDYPAVKSWYNGIAARPAVITAMDGLQVQPAPLSSEQRAVLFGK
jgi:GSH-dependent disulfide-bond oxidoreductase